MFRHLCIPAVWSVALLIPSTSRAESSIELVLNCGACGDCDNGDFSCPREYDVLVQGTTIQVDFSGVDDPNCDDRVELFDTSAADHPIKRKRIGHAQGLLRFPLQTRRHHFHGDSCANDAPLLALRYMQRRPNCYGEDCWEQLATSRVFFAVDSAEQKHLYDELHQQSCYIDGRMQELALANDALWLAVDNETAVRSAAVSAISTRLSTEELTRALMFDVLSDNVSANQEAIAANAEALAALASVSGSGGVSGYSDGGESTAKARTIGNNDAYPFGFETSDVTRMTIDASGRVGIGTSHPDALLQLWSAGDTVMNIQSDSPTGDATLRLTADTTRHADIQFADTELAGRIFYDHGNDSMELWAQDGYLTLEKSGTVSGTHGLYHGPSDRRLKKDIVTIPDALDKVLRLRGVNFRWLDETRGTEQRMGFIAQEVELVAPEVVHVQNDAMGTRAVEHQYLTALLVEAVKELSAQNAALYARLESLQVDP